MANNLQFSRFNLTSKFIEGKTSKFGASAPEMPYYQKIKHTRDQGSLQDKFLESFDSQVYPTVLPEQVLPVSPISTETFRLLSELSDPMLTELGDNLIIE